MESDLAAGDVVFVWKTKVRCLLLEVIIDFRKLRALLPDVQKRRPFQQYIPKDNFRSLENTTCADNAFSIEF